MSEKRSNGQVPEEGPDGKNLEQSEKKESFAFLEETIKPKRISRQQGMKQLIRIAICGLVLGGFACLGFFALRPLAQHLFPEKTQVVTIQEDDQSEEDSAKGNDTTEQNEQNDAQNQQEISYVQMMSKAYEKALTAKKSVVSVAKGAEQENWNAEATGIDESVSGVIVADNGQEILILSYASICEDAKEWCVTFSDKSEYKASLKKKDKNSGFAIFAVDKKSLSDATWSASSVASLGNSNLTEQGDVIFALGNIFGYAGGSGYGIVSSSNYKEIGRDGEYSVIATDMSSASEGTGILFNLDGEVIGMISSDIWKDRGVRTANAYAISDLKLVIQLLANGASVPYTGVSGTAVTSGIQKEEGMPSGIYVIDVAADSPAMAAGIQSGDVICSVNGEKIVSMSAYRKLMLTWKVGDQIKVEGKRRGSEGYVDIKFDVTIESKE